MKNLLKKLIIILFLIMFLDSSIHAQEEYIGPLGGDLSFSPMFSYSQIKISPGDTKSNSASLDITIDYYITRQLSLGVTATMQGNGESISDSQTLGFMGEATYHLQYGKNTRIAPYIGGGAGTITTKTESQSQNATAYDFFVGIDYYINEKTSFNMKVKNILYTIPSEGWGQEDMKYNLSQLLIGLKIIF
ncbi:MAG: outer membrane beta-barrel protein [Desulfobacterales bacterium]|nr:outer membrane beta-barrel protein [Desulfobacterales bacterium]